MNTGGIHFIESMRRICSTRIKFCFIAVIFVFQVVGFSERAVALDPRKSITQYVHDSWRDELPQSSVLAVIQTRDGYLWLGTYEGLVRFDGVKFTVFDKRNSEFLQHNGVTTLHEDRQGRLWVGTVSDGLLCLHQGKWTAYTQKDGLSHNMVRSIWEDHTGTLWVGTDGHGLNRFSNGTFTTLTTGDGLSNNDIFSLFEDSKGNLWVGTRGGGVNRYRDGKFTPFTTKEGLANDFVHSIVEDRQGNLWIGTNGGVSCLKNNQLTTFSTAQGLSSNSVMSILEDKDGNLWIGTDGGGLNRLKDGKIVSYPARNELSQDKIWNLAEDQEGSLWLGTNNGLKRLREGNFTTFTVQEGLLNNFVRTVFEDHNGTLWIGTDGGGLSGLKDGVMTTYTTKEGLVNDLVKSVYEDREDRLWIGTNDGLSLLKDGKFTNYTTKNGLSHNVIYSLFEDHLGNLWIGTNNFGVMCYRDGKFTAYTTRDGLSNNVIRCIFEDRQGNVWIGSNSGLNRFEQGIFRVFTTRDGLSNAQIFSFYEDPDGTLWLGTGGGLNRLKNGKFSSYTVKNGLFDDVAFQILEDHHANLWMSSNKGIYCIPKSAFDEFDRGVVTTLNCTVYGKADGMLSNQCNGASWPAGWKSKDGRLWFPTSKGVVGIDPENIRLNKLVPPVAIEQILVDGHTVPTNQPIVFEPGKEKFEFHYTALSFLAPEKVGFKYRLEGFDKDWTEMVTRRTAYFTNLEPGDYEFKVMACNNDGVWNQAGASFHFRLRPPLWRTWWAYVLYGVTVVGSVFGGIQWRLRSLRRRNQLLEENIARRTVQLAEAVQETSLKNEQLNRAKVELERKHLETERKNQELNRAKEVVDQKNHELDQKINELIASHQQADRIFSALAEALPGTVLDGKYRLDERIGQGGYGAVFKATHLTLNRPIAVKVFRPKPGNDSPEEVERFRREGISTCRVNHKNAITVLDSGISTDGIAYLVMELLEGRSLSAELHIRKRLTLQRCVEILVPVCEVLAHAHAAGIIHRDIKPDNIFLHRTSEGEVVKVVDFGIAKLIGEETSGKTEELTATGNVIGTPTYMAPERLRSGDYDGRADVYSLGITLYEMLCGQVPFRSTEKGIVDIFIQKIQQEPPPMSSFLAVVPAEVEAVVNRALSKDPAMRPNPKELAQEFCAAMTNSPDFDPSVIRHTISTSEPKTQINEHFQTDQHTLSTKEAGHMPSLEDEMSTIIRPKIEGHPPI